MSYHKNTIYETVIQCSFNKDYFNHITTNINYVNEKKYQNFRMQKLNIHGKYWIGLFLDVQTLYTNTQKYSIPIQILIPDNFPFIAPMASVCLPGPSTIVNTENKDIDPKTCLINTNSIKKWDWSSGLNKIIEEISASFNKAFPILQVQPGQNPNFNQSAQAGWKSPQVSPSFSPNYNPNMQPNYNSNNNNVNINNVNPNANNINCSGSNLDNQNIGVNKIQINDNYVDEKFTTSKGSSSNNVNLSFDKQSISSESTNYSLTTNDNQNQNIGVGNGTRSSLNVKITLNF